MEVDRFIAGAAAKLTMALEPPDAHKGIVAASRTGNGDFNFFQLIRHLLAQAGIRGGLIRPPYNLDEIRADFGPGQVRIDI